MKYKHVLAPTRHSRVGVLKKEEQKKRIMLKGGA